MKLAISFMVLSALAIDIISANAEQATIDVPFQSEGFDCIYQENNTTETYACVFVAEKVTAIQEDLTDEEIEIIEKAKKCRESNYLLPECDEEPCVLDDHTGECHKLSETPPEFGCVGIDCDEERLEQPDIDPREKICAKKSLSTEEAELCRLLDQIDLCYTGFGKLEAIQEVGSFEVTLIKPTIWENWDLKKEYYLKEMLLAYEHCRAIHTEHDEILSEQYANFIIDGIMEPQTYHADLAEYLIPYPSQRLSPNSFTHALGAAYNEICFTDHLYDQDYRIQLGCPIVIECPVYSDEVKAWQLKNWNVTGAELDQRTADCENAEATPHLTGEDYDFYINNLTPMQRYNLYLEDEIGYEKDDFLYGHVGDWKVIKGLGR